MKVTETEIATVVLTADNVDCMIREYLEHMGRGDLLTSDIDDFHFDSKSPDSALIVYLSRVKPSTENK